MATKKIGAFKIVVLFKCPLKIFVCNKNNAG